MAARIVFDFSVWDFCCEFILKLGQSNNVFRAAHNQCRGCNLTKLVADVITAGCIQLLLRPSLCLGKWIGWRVNPRLDECLVLKGLVAQHYPCEITINQITRYT